MDVFQRQVDYVLLIFIPVVILTLMFFRTQIFQINPNTSGPCWLEHVTHFNFLFLFWNQIQTKTQTMTLKYECRTFPPISSEKLLFDLIDMPFQCKLFSNFNCNREKFPPKKLFPNKQAPELAKYKYFHKLVCSTLSEQVSKEATGLYLREQDMLLVVCVLP